MKILLVSGLGPGIKNQDYLSGTLFDPDSDARMALADQFYDGFDLSQLGFHWQGRFYPLMRPRQNAVPHLTTFTLEELLRRSHVSYVHLDTLYVWDDTAVFPSGSFDAVLLSTSFIWEMRSLEKVLTYLRAHTDAPIFLGGQFSNLKYEAILKTFPQVEAILRGDGETGLPALVQALRGWGAWSDVSGLVTRQGSNKLVNADLDRDCSAPLHGQYDVVPYESMRGCPFNCKFCSFPMASPIWRYKSAQKIADDWRRYRDENGTKFIKAMDSTFTVPHTRMRELFKLLPDVGVAWEAYTRANVIKTPEYLEKLAQSHCRFLSIGFESMNATSLESMKKQVTVEQNHHAFELLSQGDVGYRCSFMTGYPGETPEQFADTQDFLVNTYRGHFMLSVFGMSDEQMPVWQDAERFKIEIMDWENPDYSWRHSGMDYATAKELNHTTLDRVRLENAGAVLLLWQAKYQHWLIPHLGTADNLKVEKLVERLGFLARDVTNAGEREHKKQSYLNALQRFSVVHTPKNCFTRDALMEA